MDQNRKKRIIIASTAASIILLVLIVGAYFLFSGSSKPEKKIELPRSDNMDPTFNTDTTKTGGTLTLTPQRLTFPNDQAGTSIVVVKATGAPVEISDVQLPAQDSDALKVSNVDCPTSPRMLAADTGCQFAVTWNGQRTINSSVSIQAKTTNSAGAPVTTPQSISIAAVSTKPDTAQLPTQPGAPATAPAAAAPAVGPSPRQQYQEAYLDARRGQAFQTATPPAGLQAVATSPWTSWDALGLKSSDSSRPTDMSHVITPDKPLSAVIVTPIDTRMPVTAVAMVDRDVYGENGRTVVIPHGSKIIGNLGSSAERVGITWTQLIRPDGVRFVFEAASGDAMGRGGIPGKVRERLFERYGYTILGAAAQAGITVGLGGQQQQSTSSLGGSTQTQDSKAVASQIFNQQLTQVSSDLFNRKKNIPVQITVAAGTRITVWSVADLRLRPAGAPDPATGDRGPAAAPNAPLFAGSGVHIDPRTFQGPADTTKGQAGSSVDSTSQAQANVGRADANGNYIPPGAPSPGPRAIGSSTGTTGASATSGTATTGSASATTRAPWDRQ